MVHLDNTIGVVHWAALQVLGDGEGYTSSSSS